VLFRSSSVAYRIFGLILVVGIVSVLIMIIAVAVAGPNLEAVLTMVVRILPFVAVAAVLLYLWGLARPNSVK
jgi:hypothetical protein